MTEPTDRTTAAEILLVEDNPGDVRLTQKAFEKACLSNRLHVVNTGEAAMNFLLRRGEYADSPPIDLILLDLRLPDCNGVDVLAQIKSRPELKRTPVVVMTSSTAETDIISSYEHHANAYINKPVDFSGLLDIVRDLDHFWFSLVRRPPHSSHRSDS